MYGPVMQDTFESCHGDRTEAMRLQTRADRIDDHLQCAP